jgi:hypothetical protein
MKRGQVFTRVAIGVFALIAWLGFFSAGLLVETTPYRRFLAPEAFEKQAKNEVRASDAAEKYKGSAGFAFIAALLCFTPTNLIFLTLIAGLLGGCASNVAAESVPIDQKTRINPRRLMYMEETPWSAVMRSFIVFLCVIAGLYLGVDDPFKDTTSAQYLRLAGTLSALAFVVGYDPSRIEQWIRLLPSPQPSQVVTFRGKGGNVEVTAAQGTAAEPAAPPSPAPATAGLRDGRLSVAGNGIPNISSRRRRNTK